MSTTHPCYALSFEDRPNPYISEQKENKIKDKKIAEPCLKIYLRLEGSGDKFPTPGNFHSLNQDSLDFYGITFTSLKDKKIIISSSYYYYVFFFNSFVCCCSAFYSYRSVFICYYYYYLSVGPKHGTVFQKPSCSSSEGILCKSSMFSKSIKVNGFCLFLFARHE